MEIIVTDPTALAELRTLLADGDCLPVEGDAVRLHVPCRTAQDEIEMLFFLRAWVARRPGVSAEIRV